MSFTLKFDMGALSWVQCLTLADVASAASALGSQVGGSECSNYLLPCTWAPGQSASCGVLLVENLLMYHLPLVLVSLLRRTVFCLV